MGTSSLRHRHREALRALTPSDRWVRCGGPRCLRRSVATPYSCTKRERRMLRLCSLLLAVCCCIVLDPPPPPVSLGLQLSTSPALAPPRGGMASRALHRWCTRESSRPARLRISTARANAANRLPSSRAGRAPRGRRPAAARGGKRVLIIPRRWIRPHRPGDSSAQRLAGVRGGAGGRPRALVVAVPFNGVARADLPRARCGCASPTRPLDVSARRTRPCRAVTARCCSRPGPPAFCIPTVDRADLEAASNSRAGQRKLSGISKAER